MLAICSIEDAIGILREGYDITQCRINHPMLDTQLLVAGRLMKLSGSDWWYVISNTTQETAKGIASQKIFHELYKHQYIKSVKLNIRETNGNRFILNDCCDIGEFARFQHKLDSWKLMNTAPKSAL